MILESIKYFRSFIFYMSIKDNVHDKNWNSKFLKKRTNVLNESNSSIASSIAPIIQNFSSVLDVGCGTGELMIFFKKKKKTVFGIDISASALQVAKKKGFKIKKVDLDEKLPFKTNEFDASICNQVLMHVFDPSFVISEMKRVSKRYVIINVPNHLYWRFRINFLKGQLPAVLAGRASHIRLFNYSKMRSILEENNLKIISENYTGKSFLPSLFATGFTFVCEK
jgi:methionine biosynthesis protein MetW